MKLYISVLVFLISTVNIIHCDKPISLFVVDPFEDQYLRTVLSMDKKTLMKIPILDDNTFMSQVNNMRSGISVIMARNTSSLDDIKLDEQIISQRSIEETWEELVVAGPITINYLSNLMVLSSKKDFGFTAPSGNYIYQYIKHPNSFRTTLVQVANQIYNAFMTAHNNMDRIQTNMQQIPKYLSTVLKLLTAASPRLIQSMLPTSLGNIERVANQCAELANGTLKYYQNVTALLQEITEVTVGTYGSNTDALDNIKDLMNSSIQEQSSLNSELALIRENYAEARDFLEKARQDYYNAYHAISIKPRFLGFIATGIIGGLVQGALTCIFGSCGSRPQPIDNTAFENAKKIAELALKNLREAEAAYDKWYSQMLEKQNKLTGIIIQLSQLNMNQIGYKTVIDILVSATKEISEIQNQWAKMTTFFSTLAIRAEATRETVMHKFINIIKEAISLNVTLDDADREFFVEEMRETADEIDRGAHLLYIMAKTYYDVSNEYMIDQIAGITGLTVIQTDLEREAHLKRLANETLSTSAKVSRMALERKQQYQQRNLARQQEYDRFIQQIISKELESAVGK